MGIVYLNKTLIQPFWKTFGTGLSFLMSPYMSNSLSILCKLVRGTLCVVCVCIHVCKLDASWCVCVGVGVCLGLQVAVIEFARTVLGWSDAQSTEFNKDTTHPVVSKKIFFFGESRLVSPPNDIEPATEILCLQN